jgi:hypothetical protein
LELPLLLDSSFCFCLFNWLMLLALEELLLQLEDLSKLYVF